MKKVFLFNYLQYKTIIQWDGEKFKVIDNSTDYYAQGKGSLINIVEKGIVYVGIFCRDNQAFFLYDNKEYPINADNFNCKVTHLGRVSETDVKRRFVLESDGETICDIVYIARYICYFPVDAELDEFDVLLNLEEGVLSSTNSLVTYISVIDRFEKAERPAFEKALEELESN